MSKFCPHRGERVVYLVCQECDSHICDENLCTTCLNKIGKVEDSSYFGRTIQRIKCRIYHSHVFAGTTECAYFNKDVSQEKICLNCEHYLGGGDWGLSCGKNYGFIVDSTTKACGKFEKRKEAYCLD